MPLLNSTPNLFSILEVVLRLRDNCPILNRNVGGGLEFDANSIDITEPDKQLPYAYVCFIDCIGKGINTQECYQSREGVVGIIMCVDGKDHRDGATGKNPVQTVHSFTPIQVAIEDSLLRWKPEGFVRDGLVNFDRLHPLGVKGGRAWVMLEYTIPYRYYHIAYGGDMRVNLDDFNTRWPDYRAASLKHLFVHYRAEGEFHGIEGGHFFDNVPLPMQQPSVPDMDEFISESEGFELNEAVHLAIQDRHLAALTEVPQTHQVPNLKP